MLGAVRARGKQPICKLTTRRELDPLKRVALTLYYLNDEGRLLKTARGKRNYAGKIPHFTKSFGLLTVCSQSDYTLL